MRRKTKAPPLLAFFAVFAVLATPFLFSLEAPAAGTGYGLSPKAHPTNAPIWGNSPKALPAIAPVSGSVPNALPTVKPVSGSIPKVVPAPGIVPNALPSVVPVAAISFKDAPRRGDPLIASSLSLAFTGAGQWYNGEPEKALWLLSPTAAYPVAWLADSLFDSSLFRVGAFAVLVVAKGYSAWDANRTAAEPRKSE